MKCCKILIAFILLGCISLGLCACSFTEEDIVGSWKCSYIYGKDKDMPTRLNTDGMKPSTQQLEAVELPTRWQRFWNAVTFGLAYAKEKGQGI